MIRSIVLLLLALLVPALALAGPAEDKGLEIAKEADRRDEGFGDTTADMIMILRNKKGQESKRELEIRTLEVKGDGEVALEPRGSFGPSRVARARRSNARPRTPRS